jgi:hypothetical protein
LAAPALPTKQTTPLPKTNAEKQNQGMGGLAAAAALARHAGMRVAVLERQDTPGGYLQSFSRPSAAAPGAATYTWETGVHAIGACVWGGGCLGSGIGCVLIAASGCVLAARPTNKEPTQIETKKNKKGRLKDGGLDRAVFDLTVGRACPWRRIPDPYDTVVFDGRTIELFKGADKWRAAALAEWPHEREVWGVGDGGGGGRRGLWWYQVSFLFLFVCLETWIHTLLESSRAHKHNTTMQHTTHTKQRRSTSGCAWCKGGRARSS